MKYLNLLVLTIVLASSNLSAQILLDAFAVEDVCGDVTLTLNGTTDFAEDNCQFSSDYSNLQTGANTLEITSDIAPLFYTSTLDIVKVIKNMDEGFESYAQGMAADFDSDMIISTDDVVNMRRVIFGIDSDIPAKVKLATVDQVFEPLTSLELSSVHTSLTLSDTDIENGVASEIVIVIVGNFE